MHLQAWSGRAALQAGLTLWTGLMPAARTEEGACVCVWSQTEQNPNSDSHGRGATSCQQQSGFTFLAPCLANSLARWRPMPRPPPVIKTTSLVRSLLLLGKSRDKPALITWYSIWSGKSSMRQAPRSSIIAGFMSSLHKVHHWFSCRRAKSEQTNVICSLTGGCMRLRINTGKAELADSKVLWHFSRGASRCRSMWGIDHPDCQPAAETQRSVSAAPRCALLQPWALLRSSYSLPAFYHRLYPGCDASSGTWASLTESFERRLILIDMLNRDEYFARLAIFLKWLAACLPLPHPLHGHPAAGIFNRWSGPPPSSHPTGFQVGVHCCLNHLHFDLTWTITKPTQDNLIIAT